MKRTPAAIAVFCGAITLNSMTFAESDADRRMAESRSVVKSFAGELQAALKGAMQAGGPVEAIAVCNEAAPAIAARHGSEKNWDVGRTSLKYRNPDNAPDEWETAVLQRFAAQQSEGADPKTLEYGEFTQIDGNRVFRYMKAIPTAEICLNCHGGASVKPEVEAKIAELYPADKARGYSVGDIRGAFTIVQPVE